MQATLGVGMLFYVLMLSTGRYHIEGVGYATVQDILSGTGYSIGLLLLLFALKLVVTSLTLGSGGSGGIFSPTLFLGATLGGAFGMALQRTGLFTDLSPGAYALVGMAAVVAGSIRAPLTATQL